MNSIKVELIKRLSKRGLMLISDKDKIEIIKNHESLNIDDLDLAHITSSIKDKSLLVKTVKEYASSLGPYWVFDVVALHENDDLTLEIIMNHKEFEFSEYTLGSLLNMLNRDESIKHLIENYEKYSIPRDYIISVIGKLKDDNYKAYMAANLKKYKLVDEDINNLNLMVIETDILETIKDDEVMKNVIKNKDQYHIEEKYIPYIMGTIKDVSYLTKALENYQDYGISKSDRILLICASKNDYLKKKVLSDASKYGLTEEEKFKIAVSMSKNREKQKKINELYHNVVNEDIKKISLPNGMTAGIEIESEGMLAPTLLDSELLKKWETKYDGSLDSGMEVVSPILYNGSSDSENIYKICAVLQAIGQTCSNRCGGHVHIGAAYLNEDVEAYKNLVEIYSNTENILFLIANDQNTIPREGAVMYSSPISHKLEQALESGYVSFDEVDELYAFTNEICKITENRYSGINFTNIGKEGKNTIEFRLSNGSVDPKVWIENINLYGGIIKASKDIANISKKNGSSLTDDEKIKLYLFNNLSKSNATAEEKLTALLSLTVPDDVQTYLDRYNTNKQLVQNESIEKELEEKIAKNPVKVTKIDLEKEQLIAAGYELFLSLVEQRQLTRNSNEEVLHAKNRY